MTDEKVVAQDAVLIDEDAALPQAKGEFQDVPGEDEEVEA